MSPDGPLAPAPNHPREGSTTSEAMIHAELLRIVANALALPQSEGIAYLGRCANLLEQIK